MKRLVLLFGLLLQGGGQTILITIQNPSFEQGSVGNLDHCGDWGYSIPGWVSGSSTGTLQPAGCGIALPADGQKVAYIQGSTISQDLHVTPATLQAGKDGIYVLKFFVASRYTVYPAYYTAKLSYGTQELGESSGWSTRLFTEITMVCPSPMYLINGNSQPGGGPPQGNNNLMLSFSEGGGGWQLLLDNISLTFTPSN